MRRIDKKLNMMKANLLAESRYLESKGLIKESIAINEFDVNLVPVKGDEELERFKNSINELLYGMNPMGYINRELVLQSKISPKQLNRKINDVVEILSDYAAQLKGRAKRVNEDTSSIGRDDLEDNIYSLLFDEQRGYINVSLAPSLRRSRIEDVIKIFTFYADRVKDGMQNYNNDSEEYNKQWGGHEKDDTNLDENRFSHWERQYEELLKNDSISSFINKFEKYRKNALANVDLEIRPVFSDIQVRFVDKSVPSTAGKDKFRDINLDTDSDSDNYESGQIMFKYNDTTCIFNGNLQGDSVDYTYDKTINTNFNKPRTKEGLQVAKTFEDMCKSFRFRLNKNEIPTSFYKK